LEELDEASDPLSEAGVENLLTKGA
jgi:hypothetical protein